MHETSELHDHFHRIFEGHNIYFYYHTLSIQYTKFPNEFSNSIYLINYQNENHESIIKQSKLRKIKNKSSQQPLIVGVV